MTTSASGTQEIKKGICEEVVKSSFLTLASSDEHTLMKETIVGRWWNGPASSEVRTFASVEHTRSVKCRQSLLFWHLL